MKTLVLCDYFLPGFRAGGPIRSIHHLIQHLVRSPESHQFSLITRDRDCGTTEAYSNININLWEKKENYEVLYLGPSPLIWLKILRALRKKDHEILYLNSIFSAKFSIFPLLCRRFHLIPHRPLVLAPRGELASSALDKKALRKKIYLKAARFLGLFKGIRFQASSEMEKQDIKEILQESCEVHVASDLPASDPPVQIPRPQKVKGQLNLVFMSRISPIKNLDYLLHRLKDLDLPLSLDIWGPLEDSLYWQKCKDLLIQLPSKIRVSYRGVAPPEKTTEVLSAYDLFCLPTQGENFGHVIHEALLARCPVLISDQTPWQEKPDNLALSCRGLGDPLGFVEVLGRFHSMDSQEHDEHRAEIQSYLQDFWKENQAIRQNQSLFHFEEIKSRAA